MTADELRAAEPGISDEDIKIEQEEQQKDLAALSPLPSIITARFWPATFKSLAIPERAIKFWPILFNTFCFSEVLFSTLSKRSLSAIKLLTPHLMLNRKHQQVYL